METMRSTGRQVIWGKGVEGGGGAAGTKESLASFRKTSVTSTGSEWEI